MSYCASRFRTVRRPTVEVRVGLVGVGGAQPIRLQSMTTSDTQDVAATVKQSIALAEVGCEIVRITAPNVAAAKCLKDIRAQFTAAGFGHVPLVADIHFLPSAAMEAVEHVEKVRVNPGNYADKKKFAVREYSDADYATELQRLHDSFSPLVKRSRELGRAMRIGTNHGSLSDRIMNRYGDTPLGMVESALEFLRIAESHSYKQIILSMKASNPKVMIQAYRLLVQRMVREDMHYPLHLGVTEAGDGEDGRIKSAIGIGSLLVDGIGDTLRVSLTEDSVYEIPVARAIADKAMSLWNQDQPRRRSAETDRHRSVSFHQARNHDAGAWRRSRHCRPGAAAARDRARRIRRCAAATLSQLAAGKLKDTPAEGLLVPVATPAVDHARAERAALHADARGISYALELARARPRPSSKPRWRLRPGHRLLVRRFAADDAATLAAFAQFAREHQPFSRRGAAPGRFAALGEITLQQLGDDRLIFTLNPARAGLIAPAHATGAYRRLAACLRGLGLRSPLWIRNTPTTAVRGDNSFLSKLLEASFLTGALLCDGLGDLLSIETEADAPRATRLAYNVLQGAGARISKTEFVACPSCGRTLFDLQTTTQRIRAQTGHLKGVKIAIMGCIVNGPGEMADADFGYVGGAPGKINLYVGKNCVQYNIPQAEADARLIALIKEHGKWFDPAPAHA